MTVLEAHADGLVLPVRARGGARTDSIKLGPEGLLRVSVTRAPERGQANHAIVRLLCRELGLKKSQMALIAGRTSSRKRFLIRGTTAADLAARIDGALSRS